MSSKVTEFIMDGWVNILTSIGIKGKDKLTAGCAQWERMVETESESIYAGDDVARNIVDVVPDDSMSKGYKLIGLETELITKITDRFAQMKVDAKINEASKLARMHGGAGILKVTQQMKLEGQIGSDPIKGLIVFSRWNLRIPTDGLVSNLMDPRFEQPNYYEFMNNRSNANNVNEKIHHTRIIQFDGMYLPPILRQHNENWGDSILNVCKEPIRNFNLSHSSAALTLQDFSIPVLKMKGLAELMTANCDDKVLKRLEFINLSKSIAKMVVLDAEKEDFDHKTRNVTGFKEILDKVEGRLVTASKMPHTKLFGNSPSGLGGTGRHEETNWYDYLQSYQKNYLTEKILDIAKHIAITEFSVSPAEASKLGVEFEPLWSLDEAEEATMRKTIAETDAIYIENQVLTPDEVAKSRFGGDKYSIDTEIDVTLRPETTFVNPEATPPPVKA